jgi:hypothetical protein
MIDHALRLRAFNVLEPRSRRWLWPDQLALGQLVMLDGDPGLGKSLVTLDLCARLSTGRPFPDGKPGPGPSNCIILNAEDDAETTIRSRLVALGADLARVFCVDTGDGGRVPRLPQNVRELHQMVEQTSARLVVIDPVTAFLDASVQLASDASVRRGLEPLIALARQRECVMLMVRHLNKTAGRRALYRGGGSIAFVAACRSAWLIDQDPENPERRVLAVVKNNTARRPESLAYELAAADNQQCPRVVWHGSTRWTADELLARRPGCQALPRDRAKEFLLNFLVEGARTSREIWTAAGEDDLTSRTIKRAKADLGIRSVRVWAGGSRLSYWLLPDQELPASVPSESIIPDLEPWLGPLRRQFPPATPLDEV